MFHCLFLFCYFYDVEQKIEGEFDFKRLSVILPPYYDGGSLEWTLEYKSYFLCRYFFNVCLRPCTCRVCVSRDVSRVYVVYFPSSIAYFSCIYRIVSLSYYFSGIYRMYFPCTYRFFAFPLCISYVSPACTASFPSTCIYRMLLFVALVCIIFPLCIYIVYLLLLCISCVSFEDIASYTCSCDMFFLLL